MIAPRDPGLQPERTELAWRRTLLALAVGSLVSVRVLPAVLGDWTVGTGLAGVVVAAVLWVLADRRHARIRRSFAATALPGGAILAVLALFTSAGAALGLLYLAAITIPR